MIKIKKKNKNRRQRKYRSTTRHVSGLVKLRELVRSPKSCEMEVHLRQADPDSYRQVLSEMKSKEIRNLIVDTRPDHMHHFLRTVRWKLFVDLNVSHLPPAQSPLPTTTSPSSPFQLIHSQILYRYCSCR